MYIWVIFSFIYAFGNGFYQLLKKKEMEKSGPINALTISVSFGFLCLLWRIPEAITINPVMIGWMCLKGLLVVSAWILFMYTIKTLELSKMTLIQNLTMVITFVSGIVLFGEIVTSLQIIGAILVLLGVVLTSIEKKKKVQENSEIIEKKNETKSIILAILTAVFTALSSLLDKYTMQFITTGQMTFWFMFFCAAILWGIVAFQSIRKKEFVIKKNDWKNQWAYIAGAVLVLSDFFLFSAYAIEGSMVSIITVISKFSIIITFFGSLLLYKEKNSIWKYIYLVIILSGIVLVAI